MAERLLGKKEVASPILALGSFFSIFYKRKMELKDNHVLTLADGIRNVDTLEVTSVELKAKLTPELYLGCGRSMVAFTSGENVLLLSHYAILGPQFMTDVLKDIESARGLPKQIVEWKHFRNALSENSPRVSNDEYQAGGWYHVQPRI